jgi:hypothetical protein
VTKAKVEFVYSKDVKAARAAAPEAAEPAEPAASGSSGGAAAPPALADSATARFMPFYRFWATPYDRQANDELLLSLGWPQ